MNYLLTGPQLPNTCANTCTVTQSTGTTIALIIWTIVSLTAIIYAMYVALDMILLRRAVRRYERQKELDLNMGIHRIRGDK